MKETGAWSGRGFNEDGEVGRGGCYQGGSEVSKGGCEVSKRGVRSERETVVFGDKVGMYGKCGRRVLEEEREEVGSQGVEDGRRGTGLDSEDRSATVVKAMGFRFK